MWSKVEKYIRDIQLAELNSGDNEAYQGVHISL